MTISFRPALQADVPAVIALLRDDVLGDAREIDDMAIYHAAFDQMLAEHGNHLIVGEIDDAVVATYQITFISGLSLSASRRAQIESVRVASNLRGQGHGAALLADAEQRARKAGCTLMQLNTNASRNRARTFYERLGFTPSHVGYKRVLD